MLSVDSIFNVRSSTWLTLQLLKPHKVCAFMHISFYIFLSLHVCVRAHATYLHLELRSRDLDFVQDRHTH